MGRPWPYDSKEKLEAQGYKYKDTSKCLAPTCQKEVQWWTTPKGRLMPFVEVASNSMGEFKLQPHFADCAEASKFRRDPETGEGAPRA